MSIIDEIRSERMNQIPQEYKEKILASVKYQLVNGTHGYWAHIDGAAHYPYNDWKFPTTASDSVRAPYRYHAAIADWLRSLGFSCCRHYNKGGVDNGMEVRLG